LGAMVYIVWGHGLMYFLMSTRTSQVSHNGAVSLLIWEAMQRANRLGLIFDLDGVISPATFRFLSGFGGQLLSRLIVRRSRGSFRALRYIRDTVMGRGVKDTFCPYP